MLHSLLVNQRHTLYHLQSPSISDTMSDRVVPRSTVRNDAKMTNERLESGHECYVDAERGTDEEDADGSIERPFKTLSYAYIRSADKPARRYLVRALDPSEETSSENSSTI